MNSTLQQLAEIAKSHPQASREVLMIPIEAIEPDPDQPRDSPGDLSELAVSIEVIGIQQPLLVRHSPDAEGTYLLVAGERRLLAATKAGMGQVPCIVLENLDDPGQRLIAQLTENLQREDLDMMEIARALERLISESGLGKQEVARFLGKSPSFVSKHLGLLRADGAAHEALSEGLLQSPETYRLFAKLPEPRQHKLLRAARDKRESIPRSVVEAALGPKGAGSRDAKSEPSAPEHYSIRLTAEQILRLIDLLGGDAPAEPRELQATLLDLL